MANDPAVTVTRGAIEETGTRVFDPAVGLRLYDEAGFGWDEQSCDWGLAVDYTRSDLGTGID